MPWVDESYLRYFPPLTWQSNPQIESVLKLAPNGAPILDLGAGGRQISPRTLCVDFLPLPHTDVVADVQRLPIRDGSVGLIFATGLLEHVEDERAVLDEIARTLRPRGVAHVELPFLQQYHENPIDCRRLTVDGLERLMQRVGLETVKSGFHIGPTVTLLTLLAYYGAMLFEGRSRLSRILSTGVFLLLSALFFPFKYLDRTLRHKRSAHRLAFGVFCTSRKPA
ncbi:MAG TPA: class I SAM-dependent methyltransferase [Thermoanaerobaculia bacterium]|nr:class I SAM-dependent methyltransferase [Thermoanaerobaculia bacterium]